MTCEFLSQNLYSSSDKRTAISFNRWESDFNISLITLKTNIIYGLKNLSSTDPLFLHKAARLYWMYINGGGNSLDSVVKQNETNYVSCKYEISILAFP